MVHFSKNLLVIAIISLCFGFINSEAKFNVFKLCACGELLYESECKLFPHCSYSNSICSPKSCSSISTQEVCRLNLKCAWDKDKCSDFKQCSKYGRVDSDTCHNLHKTCLFNPFTEACARYDQAFTSSCSSTSKSECYIGSDGVCIYENEQCQKFQSCSDATIWNSFSCFLASPACYQNTDTHECYSQIGCENAQRLNCQFSPDGISSFDYYLCQEDNNGACVDFNLTSQTIDTCLYNSFGYYHWTGSACEVCISSYQILLAIASLISLIVL